jgi:8-oxo-dGTP pyrophosphatase MutT (NUDIX family)
MGADSEAKIRKIRLKRLILGMHSGLHDFDRLIDRLSARLTEPLPGRAAQLKMSSLARIRELMRFSAPDDARQSSVLVLLYPYLGSTGMVLMQRPDYKGVHGGQVSLPGGKREDTDESLVYTALREAREEIGVDPSRIQIIGQLTEMYIPPSNFLVTPVVGFQHHRPEFTPDPKEVAGILEITLNDLLDPRNLKRTKMKLSIGLTMEVPTFTIGQTVIWGATAMMLNELKEILLEIVPSEP